MSDTQSPDIETDATDATDATEGPVVATTEGALVPEVAEAADEVQAGDEADDRGAELVSDTDGHEDDAAQGAAAGKGGSGKGDKATRLPQPEREGEVAADFLETLLDIADLDGDIDVDVDGDRAAIAIVDSEEGRVPRRLVGTDGKVLEALQELTRLAVQVQTGERSRLMLDIAGHRAQRRTALVELAHKAIAEVKDSGEKRSLEPMSAFERKVVHDEVSAAGLVSESEGVEPNRHIVILPA
jgi:spoIIIJ-associated protein